MPNLSVIMEIDPLWHDDRAAVRSARDVRYEDWMDRRQVTMAIYTQNRSTITD
jgi:hypothetical protein